MPTLCLEPKRCPPLSLDFRDIRLALPTTAQNRYGYDFEFDASGRSGEYRIDFVALAAHLRALHQAAKTEGIKIERVIFDPPYLPHLYATPDGAFLRQHLDFMTRPAWIRHDEHYHVDFDLPCQPLDAWRDIKE